MDNVLYATGKNKVIIVAHSMGGLVSRYYIKNLGGSNKVDKLIMIGTPNHGIYGYIALGCESLLGNLGIGRGTYSPECEDMQNDSQFIINLNSGDETPGNVKYYTIAGSCDNNGEDYHDEVVRVGSVQLDGAVNEIVEGNCIPGTGTFHSAMLNYNHVPEAYNKLISYI